MTGPDRLRPNEVAGTRDVDAINAIMREALGDDWASILIPQRSDPVADIIKAYKLVRDNPGYRPDPPGPERWIRLSDVVINPDIRRAAGP